MRRRFILALDQGIDGGATVNNALLQFQSDLLRVPVVRPRTSETTALGAAFLAGLATGFGSGQREIAELWKAAKTFQPKGRAGLIRKQTAEWRRAVERAKGWAGV